MKERSWRAECMAFAMRHRRLWSALLLLMLAVVVVLGAAGTLLFFGLAERPSPTCYSYCLF